MLSVTLTPTPPIVLQNGLSARLKATLATVVLSLGVSGAFLSPQNESQNFLPPVENASFDGNSQNLAAFSASSLSQETSYVLAEPESAVLQQYKLQASKRTSEATPLTQTAPVFSQDEKKEDVSPFELPGLLMREITETRGKFAPTPDDTKIPSLMTQEMPEPILGQNEIVENLLPIYQKHQKKPQNLSRPVDAPLEPIVKSADKELESLAPIKREKLVPVRHENKK